MPAMTAEIEEYVSRDRNAVLATVKGDGAAQLTPVWYLHEDGRFYVSAVEQTAKVHNLRRNNTITLCIDGGREEARYVVVYGTASLIEPGGPSQKETRRRIIRKYHDSDEAGDAYYERVKNSPAALIVITPEKIVSHGF